MEAMTLRDLLSATGGILLGGAADEDLTFTSVVIDSRDAEEGSLFVALHGENTDGHKYIESALEKGAAGCLVEEDPETLAPDKFYVKVPDAAIALGQAAKAYKKKFPIPVVAITGSVGKTTTKDMIAAVLAQRFRVLKTEGNLNNELGLPLTLFRLTHKDEICVLEMGMNHFDEIDYLTRIVRPDVAVITNIGDAHIENLGSRENIRKAKMEIFNYMQKGSPAVLCGDDVLLKELDGRLEQEVILCGTEEGLPYRAVDLRQDGAEGMTCTVKTPKNTFPVAIPALGRHMVYPVLMACAIGERFGLTAEEIAAGVADFIPTKMRMNIVRQGSVTILDDAYNANPQSMKAGLEVLADSGGAYRVAILGNMFELGERSRELHRSVGEFAGKNGGVEALLAVGDLAKDIYDGAKAAGVPAVFYAKEKQEALSILPSLVKPGAVILVKASRGMAFEELVKELKALTS